MHEVPQLGYSYDALEPHIDARTMEIHHTKHHAAYVTNLNKALEGHDDLAAKPVEALIGDMASIPEAIRGAVRNHGGGRPAGALADAINRDFGDFESFQAVMTKAAATLFGSGWAWLVVNGDKLEVAQRSNQDSPLMDGLTPILGVDVWEHAYYLNYQNRRPDYLAAWWNVVDWEAVGRRFGS